MALVVVGGQGAGRAPALSARRVPLIGVTDVLVLGGTAEARVIASRLAEDGLAVVVSLAGRTASPAAAPGTVARIGGFGGPDGLAAWLDAERPAAVVDATHPFASVMSASAAAACAAVHVPLVRLLRPGWVAGPGDRWERVASLADAAARVDADGFARAFLAVGSGGVGAFAGVRTWCLVRSIEPPRGPLPEACEVVLARGPFLLDDELALLRSYAIDVVVARDSGGTVDAKLAAARELGVPVLLIDRPEPVSGVPVVTSVADCLAWISLRARR